MNASWFRSTLAGIILGVTAGSADAVPISFTVTAEANSNLYGFVVPQAYTFTWVVNDAFANNSSCYFGTTESLWTDEYVSETPTFIDVSGSGLTGSWQRPVAHAADPYSVLNIYVIGGVQRLVFNASNDNLSSIGLKTPDGTALYEVYAEALTIGNVFTLPGSYTDPATFFAAHTGTYTDIGGNVQVYPVGGGPRVIFTPSSLSISAVPEPYAALLGASGSAVLLVRRRRQARAE